MDAAVSFSSPTHSPINTFLSSCESLPATLPPWELYIISHSPLLSLSCSCQLVKGLNSPSFLGVWTHCVGPQNPSTPSSGTLAADLPRLILASCWRARLRFEASAKPSRTFDCDPTSKFAEQHALKYLEVCSRIVLLRSPFVSVLTLKPSQ